MGTSLLTNKIEIKEVKLKISIDNYEIFNLNFSTLRCSTNVTWEKELPYKIPFQFYRCTCRENYNGGLN